MKRVVEIVRSFPVVVLAALCVALAVPAVLGAQANSQQTLMSRLHWRSVGPYIGGRVVAVEGVADNPNLFYMGAVDGGVWKSTDYGIRWTNISDGTLGGTSDSIGAIAVAPSDTNVIYVGTGESDIRGTFITGDGVYKSTDAGKTWHYSGLRDTHTISAIVVDPHNANIVYASSMGHVFKPNAERGVFKSTDGGKTWTKVLFVNADTGAIDLVMDPSNPRVLYATMWQASRNAWSLTSGGPGSGLYKTTDGGAHWTNLSHNPGLPTGILGRMGVTIAASRPNIVYTIIQAKQGGVFRSDNAGRTWTRVNDQWMIRQRAFYYMAIYADPKDPNTVYAPNVDALWVSHDGGKSWSELHTPHGDNHIVWINPTDTNILLEGNDGGATVSTDAGKTWSTEHNQPTGQFYHVNLDDQFPYHIFGAQQDEGSFEGPSAAPGGSISLADWKRVAYGESTFSVPQPGSTTTNFGSGYFSIFLKYNRDTGEYREVSPWPLYQEGAASQALKYRFAWTHPILFSPTDPKELFLGSQYLLRSDDYGETWKRISPDLTRNDPKTELPTGGPIDLDQSGAEIYPCLSAVGVSPLNDQVIWAGSDDGLVHVTTDGGQHWETVTPPSLPQTADISSIQPSHVEQGTAYLSASRYMWDDFHPYVYKTTDFGKTWTAMTTGLPNDGYVFVVRQDPSDANLLLAGTMDTVYVSLDGGAQWQPLSLNLPHVQVRDIAINVRQQQVVLATHGRSFWVLDNLPLLEQLTSPASASTGETALFAPATAWLSHAYGSGGFGAPASGKNPAFGATVFFKVPASYNGSTPVSLSFTDAQGQLVRRFTLHLKKKSSEMGSQHPVTPTERREAAEEKLTAIGPGMNSFQWNLRYPDATEVKGFYPPAAAGGLTDEVDGPVVVPGVYHVVLDYGGQKTERSFSVELDPRIHTSQSDLDARLALQLKIHHTLDSLDRTINQAIGARDRLQRAVDHKSLTNAQAGSAITGLNQAIDGVVQLKIQSSEGSLLHPTKLRSYLAYLAADIGMTYAQPTSAEAAVYKTLVQQAQAGEQKLHAAITAGNAVQ